jgi:glycerol-3-phosphate dehydrogenase
VSDIYDLLIIGGGIHGAGVARDAAGRGLRVALCEQGDFAGATSSASSKLIHGGLRYLEYGDVRLVRDALHERETLLRIAPHISRPLRFVLPHVPELRSAWMIRLGLLLYDHLSTRTTLPGSHGIDLHASAYGAPLVPELRKGFVYSDGWIDDARLVILNLKSALQRGAHILPRTRLISAMPEQRGWRASLSADDGRPVELHARALVNAAGPWVDQIRAALLPGAVPRTRLVRGSHIVVPAVYAGDHAYLLQSRDRRVVFLLPFGASHTLIGTTDVATSEPSAPARPDASEVQYLCAATTRFLREPITPERVVHSFSGVRALLDDGHANPSSVTRDYALLLEHAENAPLLSMVGGKLTTYRVLAEKALDQLRRYFPTMRAESWTGNEPLPGGDLSGGGMAALRAQLEAGHPHLPPALLAALAGRHGTLAAQVLGEADRESQLGVHFGGGLYAREVDYLIDHEWVRSAHDVLWRRTKTGLSVDPESSSALDEYVRTRVAT